MSVLLGIIMFLPICFVTSIVCTALKQDDDEPIIRPSVRMFVTLSLGIIAFCVVIFIVTLIAGSEFPAEW